METPLPVQITPQMQALLARAKNVMKAVDNNKPIVLSETTQKQTASEAAEEPEYNAVPTAPGGYTREQVLASGMPQNVKEAMMKSIPVSKPANFRLEDMSDLDDVKMVPNKRNPIVKTPVIPINENRGYNSDMITVSRTELKEMINESLVKFLTESYNKTLTEATIKKTIQTLINEGKLTVKKK